MGVVVVTYASAQHIAATLNVLPAEELARIVIVDNASPDDTLETVRALGTPNLEVVEQANVGFGAGCDAGVARLPADAEYALLLNPDCVVARDDLLTLVGYLDAHPRCALVGPRLVSGGQPATAGGALPTPRSELRPFLPGVFARLFPARQLAPDATDTGPVGYVEGAAMLVRIAAFRQVQGFDHRFFLCFEEFDLARRLADAGWTVDFCPAATAQHIGQGSRAQVPLFSRYHQYRSQMLYLEKWFGPRTARRYARLATVSWWLRSKARRISAAEFRTCADAVAGRVFSAAVADNGGNDVRVPRSH